MLPDTCIPNTHTWMSAFHTYLTVDRVFYSTVLALCLALNSMVFTCQVKSLATLAPTYIPSYPYVQTATHPTHLKELTFWKHSINLELRIFKVPNLENESQWVGIDGQDTTKCHGWPDICCSLFDLFHQVMWARFISCLASKKLECDRQTRTSVLPCLYI